MASGGGHEIGQSIADTVVREVRGRAGSRSRSPGLVYTNPCHVISYGGGEVRQQFSLAFTACRVGGRPRGSAESRQVRWVDPDELDQLDIHPSMRPRIEHGPKDRAMPYIAQI